MPCLRSRSSSRGSGFGPLGRQHRIGAGRHRSARHDPDDLTDSDRTGEWVSGQRLSDHDQWDAGIRSGPFRAFGSDRVPVHRGAIESRHVHLTDDRRSQHATCRHRQRQELCPQLHWLTVEPGNGRFDRMTVREAAHPDVILGSVSARRFLHSGGNGMTGSCPGFRIRVAIHFLHQANRLSISSSDSPSSARRALARASETSAGNVRGPKSSRVKSISKTKKRSSMISPCSSR